MWPWPCFKVNSDVRKQKLLHHVFHKVLNGIWYAVQTCYCGESYTHFISSNQYSRERSQITWISIALHSDMYGSVSFNLGRTTVLCSVWYQIENITLTLVQGCSLENTNALIFSQISFWVEFGMVPWPACLFKLMLILFCRMNIQWRELNFDDFVRIIFLPNLMIDMGRLYILIAV